MRLAVLVLLLASPVLASSDLDAVINALRTSQQDFHRLREQGEVRFTNAAAESRYLRAMRRLEDAVTALEDADGPVPPQNYRGQTVVMIRQQLSSSTATQVIGTLPSFVTQDDFGLVEHALRQLSSSNVAAALTAYYTNVSQSHSGNRRGAAAIAVMSSVSSSNVNPLLAKLPAFVCEDDAAFVRHALNAVSSSNLGRMLDAFFAHPASSASGNRRGSVGIQILTHVSSSFHAAALATIPRHVGESDLPHVTQIIQQSSSSQVAQALAEFFGRSAARR